MLYGNLGTLQIPAKTYMYLATGKPILYIDSERVDQDATWRLLKEFPGVIRCTNTAESILNVLGDLEAALPGLQIQARERIGSRKLDEYRWDRLAERYSRIAWAIVSQT